MDWLIEPLQYAFMQRALVVSIAAGIVCALLSCWVTLIGWSLLGDAVSHAVLPGVVLSYLLGWPFAIGAFVFGVGAVGLIGVVRSTSRVKADAVIGVVFTALFALGIVLVSKIPSQTDLNHILFGNVLGVSVRDLIETGIIAGVTLVVMLVKRRDFLLYCFDINHARAIGLPVRALHYGLLILLSLTIVAALKAVGIILVIAMLVAPGAIAYLLTDSFERMLAIAVAAAIASSAVGTLVSFHIDGATGACIVLIQFLLFVLAFLLAPKRGLLWHWRRAAGLPASPR
jgi:manganese/iron transport system permease protein